MKIVKFSILLFCIWNLNSQTNLDLMPLPHSVKFEEGKFNLTSDFGVFHDQKSEKLTQYVRRFLFRLDGKAPVYFKKDVASENSATLRINYRSISEVVLGMDESYSLKITKSHIDLNAESDIGIMRGLESLYQLLKRSNEGYFFPAVTIEDQPRFPWRGLLMDVARHWMPVDVIKRNIDGMAMVKLNTLHWHLTEDQGFRVESKIFPKLHKMGSHGNYYTQEQIKDVIKYANDRGIRVMPEFDIPGHATSWFVGHPELASKKMNYQIEKRFGIMDPAIDPSKENTYEFLDQFLSEMSQLFNDEYMHIGGDENNGKHWDQNKEIQSFMKKNKIKDNHELQSYFNKRVLKILTKNGKKMVGWDEIFQPDIPNSIVIQSWRGKEAMMKAAKQGYKSILSNGYYIDLVKHADKHYLNEPIPDKHDLNAEQLKNILGGEATMWAELVTPETVDSRIWPRTAAIAERFWSKRSVNDVDDMYRRLEEITLQLEHVGLLHIKNREMMIRRYLGHDNVSPFKSFLELLEPVKIYQRHAQGIKYTTDLPMTRLPDMAWPESKKTKELASLIKSYLKNKSDSKLKLNIVEYLDEIKLSISDFEETLINHPDYAILYHNKRRLLRGIYMVQSKMTDQLDADKIEELNFDREILEDSPKIFFETEAVFLKKLLEFYDHLNSN